MTEGTFPYWSTSNWPLHPFYNILIERSWTHALTTFAALVHLQRLEARFPAGPLTGPPFTPSTSLPLSDLVVFFSSDEDGDTIQTDTFGISNLPVTKKVRTDVSGQKIVADATPHVLAEDPLHQTSLVTRPTDTQMNVNIPYADMVRPLQGPENPFGDQNCFLNQNALAGHIEEQAMSNHAFKAQHLTHTILGYSANPSVDPNASTLVGSLDKARENRFTTINALRASRTQKKELKRKRKNKGDLDVIDGEDAYVGPWATWDGEHQAGFLDGVEELPEGQVQEEEEEEPEPSVPCKKAKPKRGAVGQEMSVFHGKSMTDYQGHTYMHPPLVEAPHLANEAGSEETFIPKYDINSGEITQEYDQHLGPVNTITFVDENRRFVTTSDNKMIRAWDFDIPMVIKYIAELHMHLMPAVTLHPSNRYFVAQLLDNQILMYNFWQHRKKQFAGHSVAGYACQIGFSPDGKWISSGDSTGDVVFWDWKTGRMKVQLKAHSKVVIAHEWLPHETSKVVTAAFEGVFRAFGKGATPVNGNTRSRLMEMVCLLGIPTYAHLAENDYAECCVGLMAELDDATRLLHGVHLPIIVPCCEPTISSLMSGHAHSALADLDSDSEDPPESHPSTSTRTTGHATNDLEDVLRTTQLQLDAEKTCNHELEGKNAVLEVNKSRKSKKKNVLEELVAYEVEIKMLTKKYGVMVEMYFPTTEAISQPTPIPMPAFNTADRCASK
ncbi:hypothetical protein SCLCIDRAFT_32310 [Scleroderma citrinum Foug A]|uniref:Uncharacterized protein n=1 Tax=Scleroderma citrinum Foug A TaxID=1036808 RepID=A0A0C2YT21_9AGAM|nr:hypothetical protein SCLCIDRAFT_32310 [Scleroderma citrinum Foug A]